MFAIAIGPDGNITLTSAFYWGCCTENPWYNGEVQTLKYDPDGHLLWQTYESTYLPQFVTRPMTSFADGTTCVAGEGLNRLGLWGELIWQIPVPRVRVITHDNRGTIYVLTETSLAAYVELETPQAPRLEGPPPQVLARLGADVTLEVPVTGREPLSYRWLQGYYPNTLLGTNASLTITNYQAESHYRYMNLEVQNEFGLLKKIKVEVQPAFQLAFPRLQFETNFSFTLAGPSFQQVYQVETSTNLVDWEPVPGPRHYGYPTRISKPVNLSEPRRFFRGVNRQ